MIVNLETYSDADFVQSYIYKTAVSLIPIDITGASLRLMIRARAEDPTVLAECSTLNERITVTDAVGGAFTLRIPVDQLSLIPAGQYVHSLIITSSFTFIRKPIWRGILTHAIGPTRA